MVLKYQIQTQSREQVLLTLQQNFIPTRCDQTRARSRNVVRNVAVSCARSIRFFFFAALRLHIFPALIICIKIATSERVFADESARIESMLSWTETIGNDLERVREVSTTLDDCKLVMKTEHSSPNPQPIGLKLEVLTIDLRRVGRIEQSEFRDLYLIELYAHGFGAVFRPLEDMGAHIYSERRDGKKFESTENLTLNLFIPTPNRDTVGSDLRDYVEAYCSKGA